MNDIRRTVSEAYTGALRKSEERRAKVADGGNTRIGAASAAGYGDEQEVYREASQSSFGCGNPLAFSAVEAGETVVDLGSGAGLDLLIASDKVGPAGRVIGVDMTDAMIDAARANVARAGKANVELRKGLVESLPIESESVDWVISNCVINLSPDKDRVFSEIVRVLKPGGRFSISDIVVEGMPEWMRTSAASYVACVAGAISESEYVEALKNAGLVDVVVTERLVYDANQVKGMLANELDSLGLDEKVLDMALATMAGKVWSAKITGRRAHSDEEGTPS